MDDWGYPLRGPRQLPSHIVKGFRNLFAGKNIEIMVYEHESIDGEYRYWPIPAGSNDVQELWRDDKQYRIVGLVNLETGEIETFYPHRDQYKASDHDGWRAAGVIVGIIALVVALGYGIFLILMLAALFGALRGAKAKL